VVITGTAEAIAQAQQKISTSVLTPTACDLLSATAIADLGLGQGIGLVLQFASLKASVIEQCDRIAVLTKELNLELQILGEAKEFWELLEILFWQDELRNLESSPESASVVCKLGLLPSASVSFLKECEQIFDAQSYYLQIHTGSGLGILRLEDVQDLEAIANQIEKVRSIAESHSGFLTILEAPYELKFKANVWGYTGNASDVMDKIRQQFDVQGLLSPDRMFSYSSKRSIPN
jgi:glycolate oxidase FAD binding subunit